MDDIKWIILIDGQPFGGISSYHNRMERIAKPEFRQRFFNKTVMVVNLGEVWELLRYRCGFPCTGSGG